jgi:hypothetical protein
MALTSSLEHVNWQAWGSAFCSGSGHPVTKKNKNNVDTTVAICFIAKSSLFQKKRNPPLLVIGLALTGSGTG